MFLLFSFFFVDDGFRLVPLARVLLSLSLFLSLPIEREREQKAQSRNYFFLSLSLASYFLYLAGASLESLSSLLRPWL